MTDCKRRSCRVALVASMQGAIWDTAPRWRIHIIRMLLSIWPITREFAIVTQRGLGTVMGQLDCEGSASGNLEERILGGRSIVAAAVMLEPPVGFGKVVEGTHGEIVVEVGGGG